MKTIDADKSYEISKLYFQSLREEILVQMKTGNQIGYYKWVVVGIILGFFIKENPDDHLIKICLIILPGVLAIFFDFFILQNCFAQCQLGNFIQNNLEIFWHEELGIPESLFWETYISGPVERNSTKLWFGTGQYILTLVLILLELLLLLHKNFLRIYPLSLISITVLLVFNLAMIYIAVKHCLSIK